MLKRGYEPADPHDGIRVLVDRLWLRGVSKEQARLDAWMKDLGPSTDLRTWFGHRVERWEEFQRRYREELGETPRQMLLALLRSAAAGAPLTLVYGAADTERNAAIVVRDTLLEGSPGFSIGLQQAMEAAIRVVSAAHPDRQATVERITPFLTGLDTSQAIADVLRELRTRGARAR